MKVRFEFDSLEEMNQFFGEGGVIVHSAASRHDAEILFECARKEVRTMDETQRDPDEVNTPPEESGAGTSTPQTEPGTDPLQDAAGTGADALGKDPKEHPASTTTPDAEQPQQQEGVDDGA